MNKFILVVTVGCVVFVEPTVAQQPAIEEVVKKWDAKRATQKVVQWELELETTEHKMPGLMGGPGVDSEVEYKQKYTVLLDYLTGGFRLEQIGFEWNRKKKALVPVHGLTCYFNGERRSCRFPESGSTSVDGKSAYKADFAVRTGDQRDNPIPNDLLPLFFDAGVVPVRPDETLVLGEFHTYRSSHATDTLTLGSQVGAESLLIKCAPTKTNLGEVRQQIRIANSGTVLRFERSALHAAKSVVLPSYHISCTYDSTARQGLQSWTVTHFAGDKPSVTHRVRVSRVVPRDSATADDFALAPKPGMIAAKVHTAQGDTQPAATIDYFQVTPKGDWIPTGTTRTGWWQSTRVWVVFGVLVVLLVVLAALAWRGRRSRASR